LAKGALLGARGNSGVILSQLLAGFADEVQGHDLLDLPLFARASEYAVKAAYRAVNQPVEGTILTVARESSEALSQYAAHNSDLVEAFSVMLAAGRVALQRTPDLLPILKKAGVVDSGGQGLIVILEGMARLLNGEPVAVQTADEAQYRDEEDWQHALEPEDEEGYGYDVQFLMHGENLDVAKIRADLNAMGWSTLVVGDPNLVKVHVHVHNPGAPLSYAIELGAAIDDIVVENMQMQYQGYVAKRAADKQTPDDINPVEGIAVIAVASGDGMSQLLKQDLGVAAIVAGGQMMNPSTEDFLLLIDRLPNTEIILLPNNKNIILAAEQAATLARNKQVRVVPSRTVPQGIAALVSYISLRETETLDEVIRGMHEALHEVITCEITTATRTVEINEVRVVEGQYIGLIDGQLQVADDTLETVAMKLLAKAGADEYELITLYYGDQITQPQAAALVQQLSGKFAGQEFNLVYGGQPLYPYLISLE
ncbi:MAG: DAK2 domain-containing protein, partial [Anaerolineae bacterium]|nr:DAK2 domain-containing protein [Anaerolineae bacterium]